MPNSEIAELRQSVQRVRKAVGAVRRRFGDSAAMRRLDNDVDRLEIDVTESFGTPLIPCARTPIIDRNEVVLVADTPYDPELWRDADDEGIGGHRPQAC
ncbi:hypothetical protein [Saccharopolyspora phatthalungensis]|uniref:Uncharacterized protein n=1 Tax=Saccharopolyspora phatthalungensis TaxID=664693 RepID=A0A840QH49_9PSEU|nr:hypothetical protein [Saccharopolyspora phatthalungensis]MBB5157969.1 hypothetical protein [Saccharopolyspora phatthalungensis]